MWYFYVLRSTKDQEWFYKGSTNDLKRRLSEHNAGEVVSSQFYRPLKLVYYEAFVSEKAARLREASVKKSGSVWTPLSKRIKASFDQE